MGWEDREYYREGGGTPGSPDGAPGQGSSFSYRLRRLFDWSVPLYRAWGIDVRLHGWFIILAAIEVILGGHPIWSLRWLVLLFGSVLAHEYGHCFACRRVGGDAEQILLWPLGGLAQCSPPRRPWPEFVTVVWGPLVNLLIAAACFGVLAVAGGGLSIKQTIVPLLAWDPSPWSLTGILYDLYTVNWMLLIFNLLLIFYPFDGGRLVQVALWPKLGYFRSMMMATAFGMGGAVLVAVVGLGLMSLLLILVGVFGFITCYRQREYLRMQQAAGDIEDEPAFDVGYYNQRDDEKPRQPSWIERHRMKVQYRQQQRDQRERDDLQRQVDNILAKIKDRGRQSLTPREEETLHRATEALKRSSR